MIRTTLVLTLVTMAAVLAGCANGVPTATGSGPPPASPAALAVPSPTETPTATPATTRAPSTPSPSATIRPGPSWVVTGSMHDFRDFPGTMTLLADGRVLVAGGHGADRHDPASRGAELYDASTGLWTETGRMVTAHRSGHTATLLANGQVLVAGGSAYQAGVGGPSPRRDAELYDPTTGTWAETGAMTVARSGHIATLLPDGSVLVVGGYGANFKPVRRAEIYDPSTGTWARTRGTTSLRALAATVLSNNRVLVFGRPPGSQATAVAEYDPVGRKWAGLASVSAPHCISRALRLKDDRVLVLCGSVFDELPSSAAIFDPATCSWATTERPARWFRNAVLLTDGRVLISDIGAGELLDPITGAWTTAGLPTYPEKRLAGFRATVSDNTWWYEVDTATQLRDGRVLLTIASEALLYDPGARP